MTSFTIPDSDLDNIKGQVVLITGASSGIGLATLRRVLQHGGKVFASDVNPLPSPESSSVPFLKVDVASWEDQLAMFKAAERTYGKIDHVFANAGIGPSTSLVEDEVDENGDPLPPKLNTINVNFIGVMYTIKLGVYYLKKDASGGSIVITASGSSFSRFPGTDYIGLMRALYPQLYPNLPIRINSVAPSWTNTAIVPRELVAALGEGNYQTPDVVARSVILLMADPKRHGELVHSDRGNFVEMENGEAGFHALTGAMLGMGKGEDVPEMEAWDRVQDAVQALKKKAQQGDANGAAVAAE
ncbi:NAD(P)-binding protein [Stemphylium lycopersici]|uniref:NAD(P)-binding protein n=1 Tax=Stemphylium lycopersici TaxID=183478 RepID=A0A364N895_STELY|nr:NAD(P)-binding protein [Stemphylium lycopersici]